MTLAIHLVGIHSCLLCSNTVWGTLRNLTHTHPRTHTQDTLLWHNWPDTGFVQSVCATSARMFSTASLSKTPIHFLILYAWVAKNIFIRTTQKKRGDEKKKVTGKICDPRRPLIISSHFRWLAGILLGFEIQNKKKNNNNRNYISQSTDSSQLSDQVEVWLPFKIITLSVLEWN